MEQYETETVPDFELPQSSGLTHHAGLSREQQGRLAVTNQPQGYVKSNSIAIQPYSMRPQIYPAFTAEPIQQQMNTEEWMPKPVAPNHCPPGLESLNQIDQILIHQQTEVIEILIGFETTNKYVIKNSLGQKIFFAAEESGCCARYCCGNLRHFEMNILDNAGNEVIHISRPLACQSCLYPCCLQEMEVSSPPGTTIGTIEQNWSIYPTFTIKDASGEALFKLEGPLLPFSWCGTDVKFDVLSRDGNEKVGKISKQWAGGLHEIFTDADVFGINFLVNIDVKMKALLLSACFLVDFMYFED